MTRIESMTPRDSYMEVRYSGECERQDYLVFMPQLQAALAHHRLNRALFDFSAVSHRGDPVLIEHMFAEYLAASTPRLWKIAVNAPENLQFAQTHFVNAAANRGVNIKVFRSHSEAVEWLSA